MSIANVNMTWETRADGSASNGGGYLAGAAGTDFSQQAAPQVTYSDLVIDATDAAKVTSAAHPFTTAHVGNVLRITGGPNFVAERYLVTAVVGGVATLHASPGPTASSGGTGNLGGAIDLASLPAAMVASHKAWVRSGTHSLTSALAFGQASVSPSNTTMPSQIRGYSTVRGDIYPGSAGTRPLIQVNAALGAPAVTLSNSGWSVSGLEIAAGTGSYTRGLSVSATTQVINCKVSGFSDRGIYGSGSSILVAGCEVTGSASGANSAINLNTSQCVVYQCHVHGNTCPGIFFVAGPSFVVKCLVTDNSGSSSDGVRFSGAGFVIDSTIRGNGRDGVRFTSSAWGDTVAKGNLLASNNGVNLNFSTGAGLPASWLWDGNAYYAGGGSRAGCDDTGAVNPVNASGPYANSLDAGIATPLGASPFVDAAGGDYRLNNTAGSGAALRGMGVPRQWPGSSVVAYPDFGAAQHQDSGGSAPTPATGYTLRLLTTGKTGYTYLVVAELAGGNTLTSDLVITLTDSLASTTIGGTITIPVGSLGGQTTLTPTADGAHAYTATHTGGNGGMTDPGSATLTSSAPTFPTPETIAALTTASITLSGVLVAGYKDGVTPPDVTLAGVQPNWAPARAGDAMALVDDAVNADSLDVLGLNASLTQDTDLNNMLVSTTANAATLQKVNTILEADADPGVYRLSALSLALAPTTASDNSAILTALDAIRGPSFDPATDALDSLVGSIPASGASDNTAVLAGIAAIQGANFDPATDALRPLRAAVPSAGATASDVAAALDSRGLTSGFTATAASKTGYKLAPDGLDTIAVPTVTGQATTFVGMVGQVWRRVTKKVTKDGNFLKTYADDNITVLTSQPVASDGVTETQGSAS